MNLTFSCAHCGCSLLPDNYPISNWDAIEIKIKPCITCQDRSILEGKVLGQQEGYDAAKAEHGLLF